MSYGLRLTNISRGDRSVEEYTREFFKLSYYAEDIIRDQYFVITTYITYLGTAFVGMPTACLKLEEVMELAKEIEQRVIRQGVMPDYYQTGGTKVGGSQSASIQRFKWALVVNLEDLFSKARDLYIGSTRVVDIVIVEPIDLPDLVQVLLTVVAVIVQGMVVWELQQVFVRLMAKSIRDHII